jgi:hypothetical protein
MSVCHYSVLWLTQTLVTYSLDNPEMTELRLTSTLHFTLRGICGQHLGYRAFAVTLLLTSSSTSTASCSDSRPSAEHWWDPLYGTYQAVLWFWLHSSLLTRLWVLVGRVGILLVITSWEKCLMSSRKAIWFTEWVNKVSVYHERMYVLDVFNGESLKFHRFWWLVFIWMPSFWEADVIQG